MADKTSGVNAGRDDLTDSDLPAADPFAELTRIMGFDPRKAEGGKAAAQASPVEDFKIDLEEELMREFGEDEPAEEPVSFEEPVIAAAEPEFEEPLPALEAQAEEEPAEEFVKPAVEEEIVEEEIVEEEIAAEAHEPAADLHVAREPVANAAADQAAEDLMAAELAAFVSEPEDVPVIKLSPVAAEPQEAAAEEEEIPVAVADESDEAELEAEFNALLGNSEQQEILDTSAAKLAAVARSAVPEENTVPQPAVSIAAPEDDLSVEFGFAEPAEALDRVPEPEPVEAVAQEETLDLEAAEEIEEVIAAAEDEVEPVAEVKAQEPAAVEEDDPFAMLAAMAQKYRVSEPNDSWRSSAPQFTRATPHIARTEPTFRSEPQQPARAEAYQPVRAEAQPVVAEAQPVRVEPRAPVIEAQPTRIEMPQATFHRRPAPVAAPAPEIETVDVPDRAIAVADDLDIPEIETAEEPPVVAPVDDLDAEFNNLLQQMSTPSPVAQPARSAPSYAEAAPRPAPAYAQPAPEPRASYAAQAYGSAHPQSAAPQESFARPQPVQQPQPSYAATPHPAAPAYHDHAERTHERPAPAYSQEQDDDDLRIDLTEDDLAEAFDEFDTAAMDDFDLDGDFEDDVAPAAYHQPAYQKPKRRGLLIAAIIGGVAILGVAGAVAMSMMGDAQGSAPEMVKADQAPFKVRPENPGGTAQPNQESKVYETVARTGDANATTQETLVSSTEEPIDLPDQLPDNADEDVVMSDDGAKSEDRIAPGSAEEAQAADGEALAVAPRKVRTMVVKPDGTLAPREEAEPQAQNGATVPLPASDDVAGAIDADDQPAQPATEEQAAMPANVAPDKTASIEPQPVVEGGWTMQIASESSEAAAKATYQKMLGRYGAVLDGKGVNIMKADIAGKGTFWRIRIPAESRDAAAGMCNSFKSAGGKCFVTKS